MHAAYAIVATALSVLAFSSKPAVSQAYPSRPITIIVPFAAGGPLDTLARMMSDRLGVELGQGVVIENHAGGGVRMRDSRETTARLGPCWEGGA